MDGVDVNSPSDGSDAPLTFGDVAHRYLTAYIGRMLAADGSVSWSGGHLRPRTAQQAAYHLNVLRRPEFRGQADQTARLSRPR